MSRDLPPRPLRLYTSSPHPGRRGHSLLEPSDCTRDAAASNRQAHEGAGSAHSGPHGSARPRPWGGSPATLPQAATEAARSRAHAQSGVSDPRHGPGELNCPTRAGFVGAGFVAAFQSHSLGKCALWGALRGARDPQAMPCRPGVPKHASTRRVPIGLPSWAASWKLRAGSCEQCSALLGPNGRQRRSCAGDSPARGEWDPTGLTSFSPQVEP
jgi:hypothetical protein